MTEVLREVADDNVDDAADTNIAAALSLRNPRSFLLYAGAGSGKTRSLKNALDSIGERYGTELKRQGRQIGVITYTKAARDEIVRRVEFDTLFHVATIHSFSWTLIEAHTEDIRAWLAARLPKEIAKIQEEQARSRPGKASEDRPRRIESKKKRLDNLPTIKKFVYNPDGDNLSRDALQHSEVIDIVSDFIKSKCALQRIVLSRYPFVLIDESQDTMQPLIDALLAFEETYNGRFALGLFGDMMQRIYTHGKPDLASAVPARWMRPEKIMNHRSRERIVRLANAIRSEDDRWSQRARSDKAGGFVFAYVLPSGTADKPATEDRVRADMAMRTGDVAWRDLASVKMLTLEHHMAAYRLGFLELFDPIDAVSSYRTSFRDGTLPPIRLFSERVLPLVEAHQVGDHFAVMSLLQAHSPLVSKQALKDSGEKARDRLKAARGAVDTLVELFADDNDPTFGEILGVVASAGLFPIPESLQPFVTPEVLADLASKAGSDDELTKAWAAFLQVPFSQVRNYTDYVHDRAPFGTHQGVKGLQFPRVMVIADDVSSRFRGTASYEKLLGAKPLSATDRRNIAEGKETQIEKTRRLLYVTCTRAEESFALVTYTENSAAAVSKLTNSGWFRKDEIVTNA